MPKHEALATTCRHCHKQMTQELVTILHRNGRVKRGWKQWMYPTNKQFYWSGVCVFHNEAFCYSHVILFLCVVCVITNSLIHLSAFDNCYMLSLKHHDFKILPIIILKFVIYTLLMQSSLNWEFQNHNMVWLHKRE